MRSTFPSGCPPRLTRRWSTPTRHFAAIAASLEPVDRRPVRPPRRRAPRAGWRRPGGPGPGPRHPPADGPPAALRRFGLDLCLGHVVAEDDPDPVYIGRLGLTDADGRRLLVDWRSPAAEPFFGATHANPMGLVSRRRYRWTRGRISDYWDEVFTTDGLASHARALDDQSAFIASLAATGRAGCGTSSAPSRPTRTPSSARGPAVPSSSTAARGPGRPSSRCTAPPSCSTRTRASATVAAACWSSVRTSPTSPTSPTSSRASGRRVCRPVRSATSSRRAPRRRPRTTRRSRG